ncbi:hypothetical protein DPMN_023962 [Dreissena polymorpha]|uniref:Uncharacterized protein n=1 Tax=Dreissena polymorpha TaxID=45954 RepID=A0A9D4LN83_DREPO|nr:hypothetical protein DPMN_023962 [Dreissena polymorpha]
MLGNLLKTDRQTEFCSYCRLPFHHTYTVTTPALTGAIPASDPGRAAATPRLYRGQPGLHRVRTGNDRLGTGNNRDCIGNNRDGTVRATVYLCNLCLATVPSRLSPVVSGPSRFIPEMPDHAPGLRWHHKTGDSPLLYNKACRVHTRYGISRDLKKNIDDAILFAKRVKATN